MARPHLAARAGGLVAAAVLVLAAPGPGTATAVPAGPARPAPKTQDGGSPVVIASTHPRRDLAGALATYARLVSIPSVDTEAVPPKQAPIEGVGVACPPSRCEDRRVPVPDGVKVSSSTVRVLLPPGYHSAAHRHTRYPVVFLWNGARSRYNGWTDKTVLTALTEHTQAIFVMPDGGVGRDAGMDSDWIDGSYDWETFHTKVVVPWVDRAYRTIPGARAAVGASMGGIGDFNYVAHNPGMFKAVLSISGAVDNTPMMTNTVGPEIEDALGLNPPDLVRVWGNPVLDRANWTAHNPTDLADHLHGVHIYVASGTGFAGSAPDGIHSGSVEATIWDMHKTFLAALTAARVPYTARITQGGVHDWPYFNNALRWALPKIVADASGHRSP